MTVRSALRFRKSQFAKLERISPRHRSEMSCAANCGFFGNPATFNLCSSCLKLYPDGVVPQTVVKSAAERVAAAEAARKKAQQDALAPVGGIRPYIAKAPEFGFELEAPYDMWSEGDYGTGCPPRFLVELDMMKLSATIREKENWWQKFRNPEIAAKWRQEVAEHFTEAQLDYVFAELEYYASLRDGCIEPSGATGIWIADGLIPLELKKQLQDDVGPLENVPDAEKDWHPGSNNQVLDIVHPSLCPIIYGVSRTVPEEQGKPSLRNISGGEVLGYVPEDIYSKHDTTISKKFCWLPSEFQVHDDGRVTIESYINNLHPIKFSHMYGTIGKIFERFVPLFNKVLTDFSKPSEAKIQLSCSKWYDDSTKPNSDDDEAFDDWNDNRPFKEVPIPAYEAPEPPSEVIDLTGKRLQVIVKLANIVLTPENPSYPGGSWHIEGMKNENICASGIYYYASENISESRLNFRQAVCEPNYEQNDNRGVEHFYGLSNDEALNQEVASVITKEDRCIAFPNFYQHQVQPFQLTDPSKPGYRKILVFFLVNPTKRIPSSATVPPQQAEWFFEILQKTPPFNRLPVEIVKQIVGHMDFPISMERAKVYREELMAERKAFVKENSETVFSRAFSLCEH